MIARLHEQLWAERAAREAEDAAAREAARAQSASPLVRAGRFNLTLSGFLQFDATAWNQQSQDQLNPGDGRPAQPDALQHPPRAPARRARLAHRRRRRRVRRQHQQRLSGAHHRRRSLAEVAEPRSAAQPLSAAHRRAASRSRSASRCGRATPIGSSSSARRWSAPSSPASTISARALFGGWRFLRYALARHERRSHRREAFPGRDPNQSQGRASAASASRRRSCIASAWRGDFSGLWGTGFHEGTPATKDTLVWRDTNEDGAVQLNEISVTAGAGGDAVGELRALGDRRRSAAVGIPLPIARRARRSTASSPTRATSIASCWSADPVEREPRPARARLLRRRDAGADAVGDRRRALRSLRSRSRRATICAAACRCRAT